ncbi:hypothetical protein SMJ63A_120051 [Stenotrophomonas geniculata]
MGSFGSPLDGKAKARLRPGFCRFGVMHSRVAGQRSVLPVASHVRRGVEPFSLKKDPTPDPSLEESPLDVQGGAPTGAIRWNARPN